MIASAGLNLIAPDAVLMVVAVGGAWEVETNDARAISQVTWIPLALEPSGQTRQARHIIDMTGLCVRTVNGHAHPE